MYFIWVLLVLYLNMTLGAPKYLTEFTLKSLNTSEVIQSTVFNAMQHLQASALHLDNITITKL